MLLTEQIGMTKDFKRNIETYFNNTDDEVVRISSWKNIMNYLQFYIHNPQECRLRLIKSKAGYPLIIIKRGEDKIMVPILNDRIIKLKMSDFRRIGIETSILELFIDFSGMIIKVFDDEFLFNKPKIYRSKNSK